MGTNENGRLVRKMVSEFLEGKKIRGDVRLFHFSSSCVGTGNETLHESARYWCPRAQYKSVRQPEGSKLYTEGLDSHEGTILNPRAA